MKGKNKCFDILLLLRPHQYVKNLFIFLPLFFGGKITEYKLLITSLIAFAAFSLVASGVYVFNDIMDIERDRNHKRKKFRPLASGKVSKSMAIKILIFLLFTGQTIMLFLNLNAFFILLFYILLNVAYSTFLKNISIIDITVVSLGFVLRLFIGAFIFDINLSVWIITITFLLALFISLSKRRDDVLLYNETGVKMRKTVDGYNLLYLDSAMIIMASVVIVSYILYTTSVDILSRHHGHYFYCTTIFVILGLMRFLQNTFVAKKSGAPTIFIIKDSFMLFTICGWIVFFVIILYS